MGDGSLQKSREENVASKEVCDVAAPRRAYAQPTQVLVLGGGNTSPGTSACVQAEPCV
jgi:hypothetical protein